MNNQYQTQEVVSEIYNQHRIHIDKIISVKHGEYYAVRHITPQSYTLQQKYPSRYKGFGGYYATVHNLEQAEAYVVAIKEGIDEKIKAKQDRLAEKAKAREQFVNPYKVGDILYSSWGYEQTNREFYQVVAVGNRSLKLRQIGSVSVRNTSWCSDEVSPAKGKFVSDEIHRVNIVVSLCGDKIGHTIKSPVYGGLYKYESGTLHRSWGH
jgi:hypothetical protein